MDHKNRLPRIIQALTTDSGDMTTAITSSSTADISTHELSELCKDYYIRTSNHDMTPFWQRPFTIWMTVTFSLFILTLIAGSINIYIHYRQTSKRTTRKVSFCQFLTKTKGTAGKQGTGSGDSSSKKMKFRALKK